MFLVFLALVRARRGKHGVPEWVQDLRDCSEYIFFSTDPTPEYLANVLSWVEEIGPNPPRASCRVSCPRIRTVQIGNAVRWLLANAHLSPEELKEKYPMLLDEVGRQSDAELKDLFNPSVHQDRLGAEIDSVLGENVVSKLGTAVRSLFHRQSASL
jgi:hypothetical protein